MELMLKEYNFLKLKFLTSKGGSRKGHTAFTEQDVVMLAGILKSEVVVQISIKIVNSFIEMRKYL